MELEALSAPLLRRRGPPRYLLLSFCLGVVIFVAIGFTVTGGGSELVPGGRSEGAAERNLEGIWPFSRNQTRSYRRDLRSISRKLMKAAFESVDKDKSGYLEFEEVVPMMKIFYYVARLDMIDYMVEGMDESQMNATATALAQEYFGNVTDAMYEEEARAFIQKLDRDEDGRLSRTEIEEALREKTDGFNKLDINADQFIAQLSYYAGSLYRIGMLDSNAMSDVHILQRLDATKDPKEAIAAVNEYIKALKKWTAARQKNKA